MVRPRLIVVEGPDVGAEYEIPPEGGGIGRGVENVVRLTDLAVSRLHCALEVRDGRLMLVDPGSRNRTLVNGRGVTEHPLADGDEIVLGKTRLAFLPGHTPPVGHAGTVTSRLTLEALATHLLTSDTLPGEARGRERRHLRALYELGEGIRAASDRRELGRAACQALAQALAARRAVTLLRDAAGTLAPAGSHPEDAAEVSALPDDLVEKVIGEHKAVLLDRPEGAIVAAPVGASAGPGAAGGLVCAEAPGTSGSWGEAELELVACIAHLVGVALEGLALREQLTRENRALEERIGAPELIGKSGATRAVQQFVTRVAASDSTVLILGESGVGKELVASAIHRASRRARGPFVCVNCAALSESVLESELFGHDKGAFTGALETKIGRFELADGGTLFLDEVGEIPLRSQAKFLRVLEERRVERVGGSRSIAVDVRVVAATNRDLEAMVERGEFRSDLYFRLSVLKTRVPALRERIEDVAEISAQLLRVLCARAGRRGVSLGDDALLALRRYAWPGNVRELRNALEHAVVLGDGPVIGAADLPPHVLERGAAPRSAALESSRATPRSLRELEKEGILAALAATGGNKAAAAALLEIDRTTLYKKLREYAIATPE